MAHYSSHTICHCFLTAQESCHGSKKEVSTVDGTLLVKTVTLGELHYQIWMLQANVLHGTFYTAMFLHIVTVDTQLNINGQLLVHSIW